MPRKRIIPVLLLLHNRLVKTVRYTKPVYIGDPVNTSKIFNEKQAGEMIVLDITPASKPNISLVSKLAAECTMPLSYGGSLHSVDDAKAIFDCGVEKIVLNAAAFLKPRLIQEIAAVYGSQAITVALDVKKDFWNRPRVFIHNGATNTHLDPLQYSMLMQQRGAGEIFFNAIDRDGTYRGYDTNMISEIANAITIPLIACGGARDVNDLEQALVSGASAAAAGSMFSFVGPHHAVLINYPTPNR